MPKHQKRARTTPYSRPSQESQRKGIFSRIKEFLWGQEKPTELGPPRIINDDSRLEDTSLDESRITHTSENFSDSRVSEPEATSSTSKRESSILGSVADGPNEALQKFFEEKGDADLSNMEVVGVLSLIGQAVSRNESLVDFSTLSDISTTTAAADTVRDTSMLHDIHAPPSPRNFLTGTPPVQQASSQSSIANSTRSPWTSPRPSRISARHNISYSLGKPTPRMSRVPEKRANAAAGATIPRLNPSSSVPGSANKEVTPAAFAILKALDEAPSKRVLSRDAPPSKTSTPSSDETSLSKEPAFKHQDRLDGVVSTSQPTKSPISYGETSTRSGNDSDQPSKLPKEGIWGSNVKAVAASTPPVDSGEQTKIEQTTSAEASTLRKEFKINRLDQGIENTASPVHEFPIPTAKTSRWMTPEEEKEVEEAQLEFKF